MSTRKGIEDASEIGVRIEAVELGRLRQRIDDRSPTAAFVGPEEEEVLARYGDGSQGALSGVVVDGETPVTGVAREGVPTVESISQRFGCIGLG